MFCRFLNWREMRPGTTRRLGLCPDMCSLLSAMMRSWANCLAAWPLRTEAFCRTFIPSCSRRRALRDLPSARSFLLDLLLTEACASHPHMVLFNTTFAWIMSTPRYTVHSTSCELNVVSCLKVSLDQLQLLHRFIYRIPPGWFLRVIIWVVEKYMRRLRVWWSQVRTID